MEQTVHKKLKGQPTGQHDDAGRTIVWVLSTGSLDRDGETVDPSGGEFDDFYRAGGPVMWNHDTDNEPIGNVMGKLWNAPIGEGTEYPEVTGPKRMALLGRVKFSKENPKADQVYRQATEVPPTITGGSISFIPVGRAEKNAQGGAHYPQWRMLEFTICSIGSNPDAVRTNKKCAKNADGTCKTDCRCKSIDKAEVTQSVTGKWFVIDGYEVVGKYDSRQEAEAAKRKLEGKSLKGSGSEAFKMGTGAQGNNVRKEDNPFAQDSNQWEDWNAGYDGADEPPVEEGKKRMNRIRKAKEAIVNNEIGNRWDLIDPETHHDVPGAEGGYDSKEEAEQAARKLGYKIITWNDVKSYRKAKEGGTTHTDSSSEVRSPTSTETSTEAETTGNITVTGGAGDGATTTVTITGKRHRVRKGWQRALGADGGPHRNQADADRVVVKLQKLYSDYEFRVKGSPGRLFVEYDDHGKSLGRKHVRRKLWINRRLKTAWLLKGQCKSDGVDTEMEEYVAERGLDEVRIEDAPPEETLPVEEAAEWQEEEVPAMEQKGLISPQDLQNAVKRIKAGEIFDTVLGQLTDKYGAGNVNRLADELNQAGVDRDKSENIADDVATRSEELIQHGVDEPDAVEAAMEEEGVAKALRPAVRALVARRKWMNKGLEEDMSPSTVERVMVSHYGRSPQDAKRIVQENMSYIKQNIKEWGAGRIAEDLSKKSFGKSKGDEDVDANDKSIRKGSVVRTKRGNLCIVKDMDVDKAKLVKVGGDEALEDVKNLKLKSNDWGLPTKLSGSEWGLATKLTNWYGTLTNVLKTAAPPLDDVDLTGEEKKQVDDEVEEAFMKIAKELGMGKALERGDVAAARDLKQQMTAALERGDVSAARDLKQQMTKVAKELGLKDAGYTQTLDAATGKPAADADETLLPMGKGLRLPAAQFKSFVKLRAKSKNPKLLPTVASRTWKLFKSINKDATPEEAEAQLVKADEPPAEPEEDPKEELVEAMQAMLAAVIAQKKPKWQKKYGSCGKAGCTKDYFCKRCVKKLKAKLKEADELETKVTTPKIKSACPECGTNVVADDAQGGQCSRCGWRATDSKSKAEHDDKLTPESTIGNLEGSPTTGGTDDANALKRLFKRARRKADGIEEEEKPKEKDMSPGDNCPRCQAELGPDELQWAARNGGKCPECGNMMPNYKGTADEPAPPNVQEMSGDLTEEDMEKMLSRFDKVDGRMGELSGTIYRKTLAKI